MDNLEITIEEKIKGIANKSLKANDSSNLMNTLRSNYSLIDKRLFLYCKVFNVSFYDTLTEILKFNGHQNIDKKTICVYWNRIKSDKRFK